MYVFYAFQNEQPLLLYTASAVALINGDAVFSGAANCILNVIYKSFML
jgi:hypothetical protein